MSDSPAPVFFPTTEVRLNAAFALASTLEPDATVDTNSNVEAVVLLIAADDTASAEEINSDPLIAEAFRNVIDRNEALKALLTTTAPKTARVLGFVAHRRAGLELQN